MVQSHAEGVSFAVPSAPSVSELLRAVDASVRIEVEERNAIVTLVGEGIAAEPAIRLRALGAVEKKAPIRMLTQGGCPRSIRLAVPESKLSAIVESLHHEFFVLPTRLSSPRRLNRAVNRWWQEWPPTARTSWLRPGASRQRAPQHNKSASDQKTWLGGPVLRERLRRSPHGPEIKSPPLASPSSRFPARYC